MIRFDGLKKSLEMKEPAGGGRRAGGTEGDIGRGSLQPEGEEAGEEIDALGEAGGGAPGEERAEGGEAEGVARGEGEGAPAVLVGAVIGLVGVEAGKLGLVKGAHLEGEFIEALDEVGVAFIELAMELGEEGGRKGGGGHDGWSVAEVSSAKRRTAARAAAWLRARV